MSTKIDTTMLLREIAHKCKCYDGLKKALEAILPMVKTSCKAHETILAKAYHELGEANGEFNE